ncbi:MAG: hypothetical protein M3Z20_07455 [Chloroflexota bacterium]|nr:hypothetical protein [Chloroflexota bacterium]
MCEVNLPADREVLRLLPAGHVQRLSGGAFLTRSTWTVSRCWREKGELVCAVKASLMGKVYTAIVPEADVRTVETSETGVVVQLQRASHAGR